ncbi:MAG: Glu/Leu/Phe/Val dehydrogenase dimerization domain-containing protein, partial [Chloroflexota bacterium]
GGHSMSIFLEVEGTSPTEVHGYLAIDSLVDGEAHGGLRLSDDVSPDLLRAAAHTMTLKYGFSRLPVGGAKAAIIVPADLPPEKRRLLLHAFGRALRPYLSTGAYVPGEDMGTTSDDVDELQRAAGVRPHSHGLIRTRSGQYTGTSVCSAALAMADIAGIAAEPLTVAIEGFGSVGSAAAAEFRRRGIRVIAVSTRSGAVHNEAGLDVPLMLDIRAKVGDDVVNDRSLGDPVKPEDIGALGAHIFSPCAIMHSVTAQRARTLAALIVSPGANVPYTREAERVMWERGILYLPDFVANCGGVLGSSALRAGVAHERVQDYIRRTLDTETRTLVLSAREQSRPVSEIAEEVAMERFEYGKAAYERASPSRALFRAAVGLHRRGLVPRPIASLAAERYFDL